MPTVSILVPIYGVEQYIERCAETLLRQSYSDIEYVFVNDCTKDRSVEILRQVIDRFPARKAQVRLISHERNRGLGGARHTAFAASRGRYIMHVDSDDLLPLDAVEKLVVAAMKSKADIVDGGSPTGRTGKPPSFIPPPMTATAPTCASCSARTSPPTASGGESIAGIC